MDRCAAFLRGINLGNRRIKNEELKEELVALGFSDVACFRASGNVVFAGEDGDEAALAERIEVGLERSLGYAVPVFLRGAAELRAIAVSKPFDAKAIASSNGKLQVILLPTKPTAAARKATLSLASEDDRLAQSGRELYWLPRGGMSDSELDLRKIEAALGPTTIRTKGTIEQIAAKHFAVG